MKRLTLNQANIALAIAQTPVERLAACEALVAAALALETEQRNAIAAAAAKANGNGRAVSYTPYELKSVQSAQKGHQLFIGDELHTVVGVSGRDAARVVLRMKRGGPNAAAASDVRLSFPVGARLTFVAGVRINGVWQG